jgi:hypothetical protein
VTRLLASDVGWQINDEWKDYGRNGGGLIREGYGQLPGGGKENGGSPQSYSRCPSSELNRASPE